MPRSKHALLTSFIGVLLVGTFVMLLLRLTSDQSAAVQKVEYTDGKDSVAVIDANNGKDTSIRELLLRKLTNELETEAEVASEQVVLEEPESDTSEDLPGIPLGDGKISQIPQRGYIYACSSVFGGGGATGDVPWITEGTWHEAVKVTVDGAATWPSSVSVTTTSDTRVVSSNGLPNHPTGAFPVSPYDDAYAYDKNPNAISEQERVFELPLNPVIASTPSCVPLGPIGITLSGVVLYNGLDAAGRDAVAHEVQDNCSGHPDMHGAYHYHGESDCLVNTFYEGGESTLLGYARDGFGIFSSVENGAKLTNEILDQCHGHIHVIPWNGALVSMYHYHLTDEYPYSVGCFMGTPVEVGAESIKPPQGGQKGPPSQNDSWQPPQFPPPSGS